MKTNTREACIRLNAAKILVAVGTTLLLILAGCKKDEGITDPPVKEPDPKPPYSEKWNFQWEGYARVSLVYYPKGRAAQTGLPVVFSLHWYSGTYEEARDYLQTHLLGQRRIYHCLS